MGCGSGRPMDPRDTADWEDGEVGETRGVHWQTEQDELLTEYGSHLQSAYQSRAGTAKSRARSARIGSAYTGLTASTTIQEAEWTMLSDDEGTMVDEDEMPGLRAPSLSLWYNDNEAGDILIQDVYVPRMGLARNTYYCCLQWNAGMEGGGYCGIQDHPRGRNFIFSLWDPPRGEGAIRPIYVGPGTICEPFGGEGTGLKTWNFSLGWEPDLWYTLVTRRWGHDDHSYFGFWVYKHMAQEWTHLVTLDYPVPDVCFDTLSCSFLEDWEGGGDEVRRVHFQNGFKHNLTGGWMPFTAAAFSVVREASSRAYENNFDTGVLDGTFYLQSGGDTIPTTTAVDGGTIRREMTPKPDMLPICCYLTSVTDTEITWEIPEGSIPQFQYIIYIDRSIYKQEVNSEHRLCMFKAPPTEVVELLVEDIYGRSVRSKFRVREEKKRTKLRTRMDVYMPSSTLLAKHPSKSY
ncbi:uncharacterized protein LOC128235297 isoform X1 [Mya arenaria]|nr:uncharacterized protein LOC128235297 isoform X1 [Mya arenaria]XP_052806071.1 uncharacterized protein LOC128235297 isoform X1 [Mya arenaria]